MSELDGKAKCNGCRTTQSVKNWLCPCKISWFLCHKHARAGEIFRRIKTKKKARKTTDKGKAPTILQQIQKELRGQNPEHILHPRRHKEEREDEVQLQGPGKRGPANQPFSKNMLSRGLKRKFPHLCGGIPEDADSPHIINVDSSTHLPRLPCVQVEV